MNSFKIVAATGLLLASVVLPSAANAQCWWSGYGWACGGPPVYSYAPYYSQFNDPATYGYLPRGLPHPNGPQPGGGGCYMGQASSGCGDR